ncbi:MAG: hypothetical protein NC302_10380 [Bacteroidales bacterium]|nr:hypothetical protein [Bacteroidales bacterium]MCM1416564.1 hypothetical protein [bacterium]MCM1424606.1 hypothetical protein [bacterium]
MINNDLYMGSKTFNTVNHTAELLAKQMRSTDQLKRTNMEGEIDPDSFAAKLKRADEYEASGEFCGATDSIAIVLRQMDEPAAGKPVTLDFWHDGARVSISRDVMKGDVITIGGSASPDWITVSTSVGTVKIDLNDTASLMKCLDLFSPEDINAILAKIQETKQAREALNEIDRMQDKLMKNVREQEELEADAEETCHHQ